MTMMNGQSNPSQEQMQINYRKNKEGSARVSEVPTQAIKVDALWKPIIRKFRQCIKIRVMNKLRYDLKEEDSEAQQGHLFG